MLECKSLYIFLAMAFGLFLYLATAGFGEIKQNDEGDSSGEREPGKRVTLTADFSSEDQLDWFEFVPRFEDYFELTSDGDRDSTLKLKQIGPQLGNPRRPRTYALVKGLDWVEGEIVVDFRYSASEGRPDIVVPFGFQDEHNWYYVHLSSPPPDNVHTVIMKIDGEGERYTIHTERDRAPLLSDDYYRARIKFSARTNKIEVYVVNGEGEEVPVLIGEDEDFDGGLVGIGSFDTYSYFDRLEISGELR